MDGFLTMLGSARVLSLEEVLCGVLASFVLGSAIAATYRWTYEGLSFSRSFVQSLILAPLVACVLIMAIGNNLARGLGILGTLAIIRFRTQIRDPRDIIFLFASLAVGISCGATVYSIAVTGAVCFCIAALYLHWSPVTSRREHEGLLRFVVVPSSGVEENAQKVIQDYCRTCNLIAMRGAAQGNAIEYSYQVRLIDPSYRQDLLEKLQAVEGLSEPSMIMQRSTVEI